MNKRIVFTGGPGSGKTSVIEYLNTLGYESAPEVGRKVIQRQVAMRGEALPWKDKTVFRDEMVHEEVINYNTYGKNSVVFFDRSIVDSYGYSQLEKLAISAQLLRCCKDLTYYQKVFIFPPWESIYENDVERKQDFVEAVATYHEMVSAYREFGYELIEVPKLSVQERAKFILDKLANDIS